MKMRQEAKAGLQRMEDMGQMGNSDEAIIPDNLPFDINDLDMEDDGVVEFADGGVVQAQQGAFMQPDNTGIMGYQQSQFANYQQPTTNINQPYVPPSYTPPVQQIVPTMPQQPVPTFQGFTGVAQPDPGGYDEMRTYVNDAGMTLQIPFKNGQPITPIPEGYRFLDPEETRTDTPTVTPITGATSTRTPQVGEGEGAEPEEAKPLGGFVNSKDSTTYLKATGLLGGMQVGGLSPMMKLATEIGGKASALDMSTAMYQAKLGMINQLGTDKIGSTVSDNTITYSSDPVSVESLDTVGEAMLEAARIQGENPDMKPEDAADYGIKSAQQAADILEEDMEMPDPRNIQAMEKMREKKEAAKREAAKLTGKYSIDTKGKSSTQIRKEIAEQKTQQKADKDKKQREEAQRRAEAARGTFDYSGGDSDPFGGTGEMGGSQAEQDPGGYQTSTGEAMVAKGGLMDKNKLSKQMKQSGLASK
jgi:hypothetical protein